MTSSVGASEGREAARELLDSFAKGWAKGQLDLLVSVFTPEAIFLETPFSDPLRGRDAIRRYWSDVPANQSEITVTTGEIYLAGPWFASEFKAVFRRRRTGEWVEAKGAVFGEMEAGKLSELRMYWHRRP